MRRKRATNIMKCRDRGECVESKEGGGGFFSAGPKAWWLRWCMPDTNCWGFKAVIMVIGPIAV